MAGDVDCGGIGLSRDGSGSDSLDVAERGALCACAWTTRREPL
jgi:hypothetical protein